MKLCSPSPPLKLQDMFGKNGKDVHICWHAAGRKGLEHWGAEDRLKAKWLELSMCMTSMLFRAGDTLQMSRRQLQSVSLSA